MAAAKTEAEMRTRLAECFIPQGMHDGIIHYVFHHLPGGSFLNAVLTNNLREAASRADETNKPLLAQYVYFFYNYAPMSCWGNEEVVAEWLSQRVIKA
jgi:hypothetical protein